METLVIPKPAYNILRRLTGESRPDVALNLALKDLIRLRPEAARTLLASFDQKYKMSFVEFEKNGSEGKFPKNIPTKLNKII